MSDIAIWYGRRFDFSFSTELLPNICARLRGTPARLEELMRGRTGAILTAKPAEKWSAQEHAGHLLDLDALWLARVEDYVTGSAQLTVTDLQNRNTDEANYNWRSLEDILAGFRSGRQRLMRRAEEVDEALSSRAIEHPRLKIPMRLVDHLFFVAEHDDHHLARIYELVHTAQPS